MPAPDSSRASLEPDLERLRCGVLANNRRALARAITLVESTREDHQDSAQALLESLLEHTGSGVRLGVTGVPGVGKSTFIEAFGLHLISQGKRVAVLAVDPSSSISGGSILGDKTRMQLLSRHTEAFIRPSPSSGALGGVARHTREAMLLCEAAGYDVVLVETVGVGQSEYLVASMVDFFLMLMLPGAGDELQGIKKGIVELADAIVINKADGDNRRRAEAAKAEYISALRLLRPATEGWCVPVATASSLERQGMDAVWDIVLQHRTHLESRGDLVKKRAQQNEAWFWTVLRQGLEQRFLERPDVKQELTRLLAAVDHLDTTPTQAARTLLAKL